MIRFQNQALEYAWGPTKKPLAGRKRMKVKTADTAGPGIPGIAGGRPLKPGSTLEMVVEGENVYIVDSKGEGTSGAEGWGSSQKRGQELTARVPLAETILDEEAAIFPSIKETWIPTFANSTFARLTGRAVAEPDAAISDEDDEPGTPAAVKRSAKYAKEPAPPKKPKGPPRGTEGAGKVGGRRRAGVAKKPEA